MFANNDGNGNVRLLEQREAFIRWGKRAGGVLLLVALGFSGVRGYGAWRKQHLGAQVQGFIAQSDYRSAVLVARRLLELDPENLAACRAMAEMAEQTGNPQALEWRRRLVHLAPNVPEHQLAFARSALRFGQPDVADQMLKALPESARSGVAYHQLAGANALAQRQAAAAEGHFAAALEIEPENSRLALNLALLRLSAGDAQVAQQARTTLAGLAAKADARVEALRGLTADALARRDTAAAAELAEQLRAEPQATFADRLMCFQAVEGTDAAAAALDDLQTRAVATPAQTAELITWLNRRGLAVVAGAWSTQLPPAIAETHPVPLAIAESFSFREDWAGLHQFVEGQNWGAFEALRLAVESHALRRLSPPERPSMQSETTWRAALKAAQNRPEQLVAIAKLAEGWGYQNEAEEAWWTIANSHDNARAGLGALQRIYKARQDARGLLRVAKRAVELNPRDLVAANNSASLGLLLHADSSSRRLAAKLHAEHPANRAFTATYAYALHTEGKTAAALQVLERLKEKELQHPAIATYYFVMLIEQGNLDRARPFLPYAQRATLLPEEQLLLTAATRKLIAHDTTNTSKTAADAAL